jgi:hypothetical protein
LLCLGGDFGGNRQLFLMVWLDAGVDNQGRLAFPMLVFDNFVETVNVLGGGGAREREPEKIAQNVVCTIACVTGVFVDDGNPGIVLAEFSVGEGRFEFVESLVTVLKMRRAFDECWAFDHEHAGHHDGRVLESLRERKRF